MYASRRLSLADANGEKMVLRTLYLPLDTDLQLKALAFTRDVSKAERMRELIVKGLTTIASSGKLGFVEQLTARLATHKAAAQRRPTSRARCTS